MTIECLLYSVLYYQYVKDINIKTISDKQINKNMMIVSQAVKYIDVFNI